MSKDLFSEFSKLLKLPKKSWKNHAMHRGRKYFFYEQKVIDLQPYLNNYPEDTQFFQQIMSHKDLTIDQNDRIDIIIERMTNYQIGLIEEEFDDCQTINSGRSRQLSKTGKIKKSKKNATKQTPAIFDAVISFHFQTTGMSSCNSSQKVPSQQTISSGDNLNLKQLFFNPLKGKRKRSSTHQPSSNSTINQQKVNEPKMFPDREYSTEKMLEQQKPDLKVRVNQVRMFPVK